MLLPPENAGSDSPAAAEGTDGRGPVAEGAVAGGRAGGETSGLWELGLLLDEAEQNEAGMETGGLP